MPKAVGEIKVCGTCRETKGLDEFHKNRKTSDGLHNQCRECVRESNRSWRARHKEHKAAYNKAWVAANPKAYTGAWRLRQYGLTQDDFDRMVEGQKGLCAICQKPCRTRESLCVDHDHLTGQVRGLLCMHCNAGLGNFLDDASLMESAIAYLKR